MERNTFFCNLGLYIKSVLVLILLLGGSGSAWAQKDLPYSYGFENNNLAGEGWTRVSTQSMSTIQTTGNTGFVSKNGSYSFRFYYKTTEDQYLISPLLANSATGIDVSFYYNNNGTGSSSVEKFSVGYSTDTNDTSKFTWDDEVTSNDTEWHKYEASFPKDVKYVAIKYSSASKWRLYIDDISIEIIETYKRPKNLTVDSYTSNSATLSWTPGDEETAWQIKYNEGSNFNPESEGTMADDDPIASNSYTLSGLSESSTYYAYVRAYINGDAQSNWAGPLSFTTLEQYPTPTDLTVSNYAGVGDRATLSWTNGTGTTPTSWKLRYHTATFNPENNEGSLVEDINSDSYTLTGLTPGQLYYASVLACYDGGNESNWTSLVSFTPIQAWETFENGIPSSWCNQNNNWKTNQSGYEGKAFSSSGGYELRTPRLDATAGQTINFEVTGSPTIKVYRNNSRSSYTSLSSGSTSYTAPSTGYYWLGFSGYNVAIDNIYGFSLASTENLLELGTKNMPTSGTIGGTYTASVEVRELGGNDESFDAELYYDDEKVAEKTSQAISANRDVTVQLSFTPIEEKASKKMYIKIIYNDGESELTTASTEVTMSKTPHILDETGATDNAPSGSLSKGVVWLKYTPRNGWNTICIPFVLTDEHLERIFGTGYEIFKIKSYKNGTLTFQKATSRGFSTPYLVYATNANNVDKDNIFLEQSYIGSSNYTSGNMTQQSVFKGIWTTKTYNNDDWYGVTTAGQIRKAASGASVKGYHAYFTGVSAPTGGDARITIVFEDEEGTTTDLGFVKMVDPEAEHIYTLSGQKVQKGKKGIYIVNGRKVVIK